MIPDVCQCPSNYGWNNIADDIKYDSQRNYTLNHLLERVKIYNEENFNYELSQVKLK